MYFEKERLSEFAGVLSHDLQNSVQVAHGRLELLKNSATPDERAEHLEAAKAAVTRIEHVIDDVLAISQPGEGGISKTTVDVSALAGRVWSRVNPGHGGAAIENGIVITADRRHLEHLLTNLFRNAVEHAGESVHVWLGRLNEGNGFFFEDDGPGIAPEAREKVFDWQHSTKAGGTGIGLKSVKQITRPKAGRSRSRTVTPAGRGSNCAASR